MLLVDDCISSDILRNLVRERGWRNLTLPQKLTIPKIKAGYNVLLVAPTGYGKTEAALLPIFEMMLENNVEPVSVIYITPLKALINDLTRRLAWWASRLGFIVARKHGDVPSYERAKRLRKAPHILVTTPEGLKIDLDWASKFRKFYTNVKWVIIDEVHELVLSKRGIQLSILLERLKKIAGRDFQRIALSATIGNPEVIAKLIFGSSRRKHVVIEINEEKTMIFEIDSINEENNDGELWNSVSKTIMKHVEQPSLIFVNSRAAAERLHEVLEKHGLESIGVHHSSVSKDLRLKMEDMLSSNEITSVICTKTLELGIDVENIKKVIQFQPPGSTTALLQRVGRSGHRASKESRGVIVCLGEVDVLEALATAILAVNKDLEEPCILEKPLDVLAKEILGIILQYEGANIDTIYEIIKGAYPYRNLTKKELINLLRYLAKNSIITLDPVSQALRIGPMFFKIWRFNIENGLKTWWMKSFSEFFTTISEKQTFQVKYGTRTIGDIDSHYVYRFLRVGDVFRLSGRNWKVLEIDDSTMRILVIPSDNVEAEIPIWKGEGIKRSSKLSKTMGSLLTTFMSGSMISHRNIVVRKEAVRKITKLINNIKTYGFQIPDEKTLVVEKVNDETIFLYWMGQNLAETLSHILMYFISAKYTLNVQAKVSHIGFSIKVRGVDPLKLLLSIDTSEVEELIMRALDRSPLYHYTLRELQLSFGKIGKVSMEDKIIHEEAKRQVIARYMNVNEAKNFIEKLKNGKINIVTVKGKNSPLGEHIIKLPPVKPWIKDSTLLIIQTLEDIALTADELSEILELPRRTIEHKLKELRKPGVADRVVQFIDVDINEWRWVLLRNIKHIYKSPEYSASFKPLDIDEIFTLYIKPLGENSYYTTYFTVRELLGNIREFLLRVPFNEIYEVRVVPLNSILGTFTPKYFYVSKQALPYITLNGVTYLQIAKGYG
ncbi:MAG: ATP-dependent helicase [Thermoprotei archaeon]|nr:MAG: ATP-dependent helicase [Thermoprotei archaeon]